MKKRFLPGLLLGALFLYLALRKVDFSQTWETLRQARYSYFILFVVLTLLGLWLRAVRWRVLMRPIRSLPARRLLSPLSIGLMANFVVPVPRAGEVIRAYLAGRKEGVSKSATFATVVVERLFDGLAIVSFIGLAPLLLHRGNGVASKLIFFGGVSFLCYAGLLLALLILSHRHVTLTAFLNRRTGLRRLPLAERLLTLFQKFIAGLEVLRSWREVGAVLLLSLVIWGLMGLGNALMMQAVRLDLPLYAAFFLLVAQSIGVMIPAPGFVGPYQYAHIVALAVYGVSEGVALSLALLIHSGYLLTFVGAGLFFLAREHLTLRDLEAAAEENSGAAQPLSDGSGKGPDAIP